MKAEELTLRSNGYLYFPIRVRERYLVENFDDLMVRIQLTGEYLQISFWCDRMNTLFKIPLEKWLTTKERKRSFAQGSVYIKEWVDCLVEQGETVEALVKEIEVER